jgi:hypothetical protein
MRCPSTSFWTSLGSIGAVGYSSTRLWNLNGDVSSGQIWALVWSLVSFSIEVVLKTSIHGFGCINFRVSYPLIMSIWVHPERWPVVCLVTCVFVVILHLGKAISTNRKVARVMCSLIDAVPSVYRSSSDGSFHRSGSSFDVRTLHKLWFFVSTLCGASTGTDGSKWSVKSFGRIKRVLSLGRKLLEFDGQNLWSTILPN